MAHSVTLFHLFHQTSTVNNLYYEDKHASSSYHPFQDYNINVSQPQIVARDRGKTV